MGDGKGGTGVGPCATSACPAITHRPIPAHVSARTRRISRFTNTVSLKGTAKSRHSARCGVARRWNRLLSEIHLRRLLGLWRDFPIRMFLEPEHLRRHVG